METTHSTTASPHGAPGAHSSTNVVEITDTNFAAEALKSPLPILIDFGATWCAPCRAIAPHVSAIATAYAGRARVATCDIDDNPKLASELGIRSVPTLLMFKDGQVVGQIVGAVPRAKIEALVTRALT